MSGNHPRRATSLRRPPPTPSPNPTHPSSFSSRPTRKVNKLPPVKIRTAKTTKITTSTTATSTTKKEMGNSDTKPISTTSTTTMGEQLLDVLSSDAFHPYDEYEVEEDAEDESGSIAITSVVHDTEDRDKMEYEEKEEEEEEEEEESEGSNVVILCSEYSLPGYKESKGRNAFDEYNEGNNDDDIINMEVEEEEEEEEEREKVDASVERDEKATSGGGGGMIYVAFYSPARMSTFAKYEDRKKKKATDSDKYDVYSGSSTLSRTCKEIVRAILLGFYAFFYDIACTCLGWVLYRFNKISSSATRSDLYPDVDYSHVEICTERHTYFIKWGGTFTRLEGKFFSKDKYAVVAIGLSKTDYEHVVRCCDQAYESGIGFNYYGSVFNFILPKPLLRALHGKPVASSLVSSPASSSSSTIVVGDDYDYDDSHPVPMDDGNIGYRTPKRKFCSEFIAETLSGTSLFTSHFHGGSNGPTISAMTYQPLRRYHPQLVSPNHLYELIVECARENPTAIACSYKNISTSPLAKRVVSLRATKESSAYRNGRSSRPPTPHRNVKLNLNKTKSPMLTSKITIK